MTQTTTRPDHLHPDHSCLACQIQENEERAGHEPSGAELHPDYVPPPPARRWYTFVGGPLHGARRIARGHPEWRTAEGKAAPGPDSRLWVERRYLADHESATYRWQPPAPEARYRYEGGPLDGRMFLVGAWPPLTTWRTYEGCPIERADPEVERYYRLDREARTYRASPPRRT